MSEHQNIVLSTDVRNDKISTNKMLSALSAIALEMQKFHSSAPISLHNFSDEQELNGKLSLCKSNLRLKKKQIKLLKENLRTACIVAKTVMSAKENETTSLHNHINSARSECADLSQKNQTSVATIHHLTLENRMLKNKLDNLEKFIDLGYQELQKIRGVPCKNIPAVMQLKEIILSCGQYYADFTNANDTRLQVEQKNRFCNNKLNIIGSNLQGVLEELKNVRYQNVKLLKENVLLKSKYYRQIDNYPGVADTGEDNRVQIQNFNYNTSLRSIKTNHRCDLSTHLLLVKNLLNNQDNMLKDLKNLSEKLSIT